MIALLDKLEREHGLTEAEYACLLDNRTPELADALFARSVRTRRAVYGTDVYVRGLIEFTNYCKNNCYYCGIRAGNTKAERYRLSEEDILACCEQGYRTGYRTFVLQGGEDPLYTPERIEKLVRRIKERYPDCALTLSVGEHPREVYQRWYDAGADRYLLRHETADCAHYATLHPAGLTLTKRMQCLHDLKEIGYQVGCGFMVGSPGQTSRELAKDLTFIQTFRPHMVGIGPFIPHRDTPFGEQPAGEVDLTLFLLALVRLMLPDVLLPATTALGTAQESGRERGILVGANVCMPNLSPPSVRQKYMLYDNKLASGAEAAEEFALLTERMDAIGYRVVVGRGDCLR